MRGAPDILRQSAARVPRRSAVEGTAEGRGARHLLMLLTRSGDSFGDLIVSVRVATLCNPCGLFRLYTEFFNERSPFLSVGFHQRAQRFGYLSFARENLQSEVNKPRSHPRIGKCLPRRGIELADDVAWRTSGREQPVPLGVGKRRQA